MKTVDELKNSSMLEAEIDIETSKSINGICRKLEGQGFSNAYAKRAAFPTVIGQLQYLLTDAIQQIQHLEDRINK